MNCEIWMPSQLGRPRLPGFALIDTVNPLSSWNVGVPLELMNEKLLAEPPSENVPSASVTVAEPTDK